MPVFKGKLTIATIQNVDAISTHIDDLFSQAVNLFHETQSALVISEREHASIKLLVVRDRAQGEIERLKEEAEKLDFTAVAGMYAVAGYTKDQCIMRAKEDLLGLQDGIEKTEELMQRMVADVVYGV